MPKCSFCGVTEKRKSPLCQTCGALRYPISKKYIKNGVDKYRKIKKSALVAVTIFTPGSLFILALLGVKHIGFKKKYKKTTFNHFVEYVQQKYNYPLLKQPRNGK